MDNLRVPLITLFKEQNPYRIIKNYLNVSEKIKDNYITIDKKYFIDIYQQREPQYSKDEIENIYELVEGTLDKLVQGNFYGKSVFNLILIYAREFLENTGQNVRCRYKDLLKWRMTTLELDQDLFVASFLAFDDLLIRRKREYFDWDIVIKSNNIRLHNMLSKGMAENHFHLKGSAPTFKLNWIELMNNIHSRNGHMINKEYERLEKDLDGSMNLNDAIVVAALIRIILFKKLQLKQLDLDEESKKEYLLDIKKNKEYLKEILGNKYETEINKLAIARYSGVIQSEINVLKTLYGLGLKYKSYKTVIDYTLGSNIRTEDNLTKLFAGERAFLYECFKAMFSQDEDFIVEADLFYAYIIIKNKFRAELIQQNERVGFSNFADYQDRKTKYLRNDTLLKDSVEAQAILSSIKYQNIKSIEARIIPSIDVNENIAEIRRMDEVICNTIYNDGCNTWLNQNLPNYTLLGELSVAERKALLLSGQIGENGYKQGTYQQAQQLMCQLASKYFYVYHFPKAKDPLGVPNVKDNWMVAYCRHYDYRQKLKEWATAIYRMRERNQEVAVRILGIDACANELDTRPEVYGQAFRFLKGHLPSQDYQRDHVKGISIPRLRATYHVGEDFLDILDGLRSIDEAITFLKLTHGDRLGHAIVLGIDVEDWYYKKGNRVYLTKQAILDNIAWLIVKIKFYQIPGGAEVIDRLTSIYNKYYTEIYCQTNQLYKDGSYSKTCQTVIPVDVYMEAWKLRGDNPGYYQNKKMKISYWDRCSQLKGDERVSKENSVIEQLYIRYHYDEKVKLKGYEKEVFKVPKYIVSITKQIQRMMQNTIREFGIGIECNPSSNVRISNFKRYDKHPILHFNNLGLVDKDIKEMAQLFVSINTDDQGVFDTLLENEYALMAIALEKMKDENGNPVYNQSRIYDWLDRVREMGLEQSFNHKINY